MILTDGLDVPNRPKSLAMTFLRSNYFNQNPDALKMTNRVEDHLFVKVYFYK